MTEGQMYWLLMLDNVHDLCTFTTVLLAVACGVQGVFVMVGLVEDIPVLNRTVKRAFAILGTLLVLSALAMTFIPTTRQLATVIVVPRILNAVDESPLPGKLMDLASEWVEYARPSNVVERVRPIQ